MLTDYLKKIVERENLNQTEAAHAFDDIMSGEATPAQIAAFITALRMKGETVDEIAGGAASMRRHAVFIDTGLISTVDTPCLVRSLERALPKSAEHNVLSHPQNDEIGQMVTVDVKWIGTRYCFELQLGRLDLGERQCATLGTVVPIQRRSTLTSREEQFIVPVA